VPDGRRRRSGSNARRTLTESIFQYQERDQNGSETNMNTRQSRPASSFAAHPNRSKPNNTRAQSNGNQNAQRRYAQYLELARVEARSGNTIGAENYYQHAEHYFRAMADGAN
jgi:Domain of unknown function (DUF4167)